MAWRTSLGYEAFLDYEALSWLRMLVALDGGVLEEDTLVSSPRVGRESKEKVAG